VVEAGIGKKARHEEKKNLDFSGSGEGRLKGDQAVLSKKTETGGAQKPQKKREKERLKVACGPE